MLPGSIYRDIMEWAESDYDGPGFPEWDRDNPAVLAAIQKSLSRPVRIDVVERVEIFAKSLWPDVLHSGGTVGGADALSCGKFFSKLGFLFKYKPYGTKIASPFGYSIFDLNDGQGFSFQLHVEPKLEAFHILQAKSRSLVYISSRQEWRAVGERWARMSLGSDAGTGEHFVWRPEPGDVIRVMETEVVHSVLGCVLEEYASCSVDAVERLFDQNERASLVLPAQHPDVAALLRKCRHGQPRRLLERVQDGWSASAFQAGNEKIMSVKGELEGSRIAACDSRPVSIPGKEDFLTLVIAVEDPVDLRVDGHPWRLTPGTFGCVPPGLDMSLTALEGETCVAVFEVSRALIQTEWTR